MDFQWLQSYLLLQRRTLDWKMKSTTSKHINSGCNPDFGPTISVKKKLKGITIDVAIFECQKRRIETPYR